MEVDIKTHVDAVCCQFGLLVRRLCRTDGQRWLLFRGVNNDDLKDEKHSGKLEVSSSAATRLTGLTFKHFFFAVESVYTGFSHKRAHKKYKRCRDKSNGRGAKPSQTVPA